MEDDLSEKQAYLRENILEKGYDAEEFMKHLQNKKGESSLDLSSWNLDELKEAVNEFTKENKIIEDYNPNENENSEENIKEKKNEVFNIEKYCESTSENFGIIIKEEYGKCSISELTNFSKNENIKVKLSNPEKVSGGIFSKSFISYTVETQPFNFKTKKRYSDFLWLRNALSLIYANCVIPPLCKKNYVDRFSDILINKRMRSIEKFMNGLLIHPLIKNSQLLYDFLSTQNEEDFNKIKKKYENVTSPTHIGEIKTLEGDIKISVSKEKEMYLKNIQDNCFLNEELLEKITKAHKALMNSMSNCCDKMKEISNLWKQVYEKSVKYLDVHNTSKTYDILSKVMNAWAETEKQQIEILNVYAREYFRYIKNEYHSMHDMAEYVETNQGIYRKSLEKLDNTKENLFKQQDLTQWGLSKEDLENKMMLLKSKDYAFSKMLPKETKRVNMLKAFYGGYLNSIISEYERLRFLNAKRHKDNIDIYLRKLGECIADFHVTLADRLTDFSFMKDEDNNSQPFQLDKNEINEGPGKKEENNN